MLTRRNFLKGLLAAGAGACCNAAFGPLGSRYAMAQSSAGAGNSLIMFNQFGGCDPLNSFAIPYTVGDYYQRRPSIAIPQNVLLPVADGSIGFHPALPNLKRIFDQGDVSVIRGIGDPKGTRSHFTSQDIFSRGMTEDRNNDGRGWLGRLGDLYFSEQRFNTLGIGVGGQLDFAHRRENNVPLVLHSLENFRYDNSYVRGLSWNGENELRREMLNRFTETPGSSATDMKGKVDSAQLVTQDAVGIIQSAFEEFTPSGVYGDDNAARFFKEVATTLNHGFQTKVYYGGLGGWDNHADQGGVEGTQAGLLAALDGAIGAFEVDAKLLGWWNRVAICIFTEFGRKTFENGSAGTDHGWGSAMIVLGGAVNGGLRGPATTAAHFQEEWLPQQIDFRNPFSEMITWLGFDPNPVFPESYTRDNLGLFT